MPPTDLVRHCFKEPFGEGSRRNPSDLTPTARVLEAIIRRTLLPKMGYKEGLTRLQLWLLNALMQQTLFDIWDLLLSEMEDMIAGSQTASLCTLDHIPYAQGCVG